MDLILKTELMDSETLPVGGWRLGEMLERGPNIPNSSYEISKSWDVMHSVVTTVTNTVLRI